MDVKVYGRDQKKTIEINNIDFFKDYKDEFDYFSMLLDLAKKVQLI